jgi:Zn-dependent peptidase ImmA (M78 family)
MKGVRAGLSYEFRWASSGDGTAAETSRGHLSLDLAGHRVWGDAHGFLWSWVDLLEHLATNWGRLFTEEIDPLGLATEPSWLRKAAEMRWQAKDKDRRGEEAALARYLSSHDLADACGGVSLAPLWIIREGTTAVVSTKSRTLRRPLEEVRGTLSSLGDEICGHLSDDARSAFARNAWLQRAVMDASRFFELTTGLSKSELAQLTARTSWKPELKLEATSQLVAAGMTAHRVSADTSAKIIDWISTVPKQATTELDALTRQAEVFVFGIESKRAFEQGLELAQSLRATNGMVDASGRVDPEALFTQFGVRVDAQDLAAPEIEAVACWGPSSGPAVLINTKGRFSRGQEGRRATCAHELCHLLVDRRGGLPLAEVLGGSVPELIEKRASAFAAEFLLPQSIAYHTIVPADDVEKAISHTRRTFGVSAEIIAWQVVRYGRRVPRKVSSSLRSLVSRIDDFDDAVKDLERARRQRGRR